MKYIDQLFQKHTSETLVNAIHQRELELQQELERFDSIEFTPQNELEAAIYYYMRLSRKTYCELAIYGVEPDDSSTRIEFFKSLGLSEPHIDEMMEYCFMELVGGEPSIIPEIAEFVQANRTEPIITPRKRTWGDMKALMTVQA